MITNEGVYRNDMEKKTVFKLIQDDLLDGMGINILPFLSNIMTNIIGGVYGALHQNSFIRFRITEDHR